MLVIVSSTRPTSYACEVTDMPLAVTTVIICPSCASTASYVLLVLVIDTTANKLASLFAFEVAQDAVAALMIIFESVELGLGYAAATHGMIAIAHKANTAINRIANAFFMGKYLPLEKVGLQIQNTC
jgi:hypothetical protein